MNKTNKARWTRTLEPLALAVSLALPAHAGELPGGGQVVAGTGTIETNGDAMTIHQSTDRMIANWQSFSVGAGNSVTFNQPNAGSVALNRVIGDSASQILGNLTANGQIFLVNPNGVLFGQNAQVNVGALVASTLDIGDADFLGANYRFRGIGGEIRNAGTLDGAVVALIAPLVTNEGTIDGNAALAGGTDVTLDFAGDGLLSVQVDAATVATLVENRGLIQANGGTAILTARGASAALASAVNNSGVVEASSLTRQGGRILLDAGGGQTTVTGTLNASSANDLGGRVVVTGDRVLLEDGARLTATGGTGGGEIYVGGSWQAGDTSIRQAVGTAVAAGAVLDASATNSGNGGTVVAWSDINDENSVTRAYGTFLARGGANGGDGGRIETSGHWLDTRGIKGGADSVHGLPGEWLFDPYNVTISAGAGSNIGVTMGNPNIFTPSGDNSTIMNTDLNSWLNGGTNVRVITGTAGTQIGDIYVNAPITRTIGGADATLTLRATNSIVINQAITATAGRLNLVLDADYNSADNSGDGAGVVMLSANIDTNGGNLSFGSGRTATIGGVATLVGGDVFVSGAGARSLTTGGGTLDVRGEMIVANTNGLTVSTSGGNVRFWGLVNSGNQYTYVDGPDGQVNSWDYARTDARNGTAGGAALGDSYLVNITSRLENSVAVAAAGYNGSWIGAYRPDWASTSWTWADGPEAGAHFFTQGNPNSGSATAGYYANFGSGEPNGCVNSVSCETVGQFFGTGGQWNDLGASTAFQPTQSSIYAVLGYVRETNINNSPLVVDAGAGTVTFSGGVGATKALASLDVSGGSVTVANGARTSGTLAIDALSGNLAITGAINSSDTTSSAIILNAGASATAGTAAGGDIVVGGGTSIAVGAGGRATLFTGSVSGSTGLAGLIGSGSGRFRYNSDETGTNYTTVLGTGAYGIFREQPTIAITANQTITYGQAPAPSWSATGRQNGDTNAQAITSGPTVAMDAGATLSSSGRYTAGSHTIDVSGSVAGGLGYAFSLSDGALTVTPASISAITGITAQNRIYDGTTAATLNTASAGFTGLFAGDVLGVGAGTGSFLDRHAGNGKTVNITGLALSGADSANYTLAGTTASTTANIGRAGLTVSTADVVKTYDGTIAANGSAVITSGQLFGGDVLSGGTFGFTSWQASAGDKTVTVADVTVNDGNGGNDYDLTLAANTTSTIDRAVVSITGVTAQSRIYDGTRDATPDTGGAYIVGTVAGDVVAFTVGAGEFLDKHVGGAKTVNITGLALYGFDAPNYTLSSTTASTTASITPATITAITGIAAHSRVYDGTTGATLDAGGVAFTGMIGGDLLTLGGGGGSFLDKNVGAGKNVNITGLSLSGADAANYTLASSVASATASITPATIGSITGIGAEDRVYDGTTAATLDTGAAIFNGMIAGDVLSVGAGTGSFLDKHAGTGKTVDIVGLALGGADAANYSLSNTTASTAADITPATISSIAGIAALSRVYDGTTTATLDAGGATFNGMVVGDVLTIGAGGGAFLDKHVGGGKVVNITGLALSGADAANYTLASAIANTAADITPATISAIGGIVARSRVYDGTTAAALDTGGANFHGSIASDALSVGAGGGAFLDKNVGGGKAVSITGLALAGADAANYVLATSVASAIADITPATITSINGVGAQDRVYDGTTTATLIFGGANFDGMVAGDVLNVGAGTGSFLDRHAGAGKSVSIAGLALGGADAANYTLASTTATSMASITPATITAITGITALSRAYDGTSAAALDLRGAVFGDMIAGDSLAVASASGAFGDPSPGPGRNVRITGLALGGADAANYRLADDTATTTASITQPVELLPPSTALLPTAATVSPSDDRVESAPSREASPESQTAQSGTAAPGDSASGSANVNANATGQRDPNAADRAPLSAMSVVEAPGSAVLVTFTLAVDGTLTVQVPEGVAASGLGSEDDLRRLASEKLGVEPGLILSIQIVAVAPHLASTR